MIREWSEMPREKRLLIVKLYTEQPLSTEKLKGTPILDSMVETFNVGYRYPIDGVKMDQILEYLRKSRSHQPSEYQLPLKTAPRRKKLKPMTDSRIREINAKLLAACKMAMMSDPLRTGKPQIAIDKEAWDAIRAAIAEAELMPGEKK